jgi:hypothetical protein
MVTEISEERVLRSYRKARTYPKTIRKLANVDLPYPVTIPQLAVWVGVFVALWYSEPMWSVVAGSLQVVVLLGAPTVAAILIRHLRLEGRSPVAMAAGLMMLALAPRNGTLAGRPLHLPRPAIYGGRLVIEPTPDVEVS